MSFAVRPVAYYSVTEVANMLGWPAQRARRWMMRTGLAVKIAGRWFAPRARFREVFPDLWEEVNFTERDN